MTVTVDDRRWVVLGLASPRSGWFGEVARWANSSAIPVDFVKCVSAHEIRARLNAGRSYSALLVGSDLPSLDRDLVDTCRAAGAAVIVIGNRQRDWAEVGVSAALPEVVTRSDLMAALTELAPPIARIDTSVADDDPGPEPGWRGHLVAVTGPGGAGCSVIAMAIAQGLAADASNRGLVVLADLALDADQAMLHDAREVVPGIQELVEGHRGGRLGTDQIRAGVFEAADRGYHLLLGLRRHRDWTVLRPRALNAALQGLQRSYRVVVADVEPDIEGESQTGSIDVEDRNLMARTVLLGSDLVVVVGGRYLKGLHALTRTVGELIAAGVDPERVVVALNRTPRSPRIRAQLTTDVVEMLRNTTNSAPLGNPVFIPERRDLDTVLRDGVRLPVPFGRTITTEVRRRIADLEPRAAGDADPEPVPVAPGTLGHWAEEVG